ncbi:MAG: T9SS type A sorting domain-containing protein [Ignavibacteria bacterium]
MNPIKISVIISSLILLVLTAVNFTNREYIDSTACSKAIIISSDRIKGVAGYKGEAEYFDTWNYPYKHNLPKEVHSQMWTDIRNLPSEKDFDSPVENKWRVIGPYGMNDNNTSAKYTGRILDVEVDNTTSVRVATATGGLWGYFGAFPLPLSDDINCLAIGSFDSYPGNSNTILLGTGEYYTGSPSYQNVGNGLWKTTDGGYTWTHITMTPEPQGFSRIRYSTQNPNIVHAATVDGYYRSTNSGSTWTKVLNSSFFYDMAIDPSNNNNVYLTYRGGMFKSTNAGANFIAIGVVGSGFPTNDVARISITVCQSSPQILYTGVERSSDNTMLGAYKSTNSGLNWQNVTPDTNVLGGQGNYDNVIAASPVNANIVLFGGIRMWRTSDGGANWVRSLDEDIHADQHAIVWKNGNEVYVGNDGGLCYSTNAGLDWVSNTNIFPITQYVSCDVSKINSGLIYGGSRDNGLSGTTNGGLTWTVTKAGDGSGIAMDPFISNIIYATSGAYNGAFAWKKYKSTDYGATWTEMISPAFDSSQNSYTKVRTDGNINPKVYLHSEGFVYVSTNRGDSWSKLNPLEFNAGSILNLSASRTQGVLYVCLNASPPSSTNKLKVYDGGVWYERSSGLPANVNIRNVTVHQNNDNIAYAVVNGLGGAGQKLFKTTNRGVNWINISGDIPNIPLSDVVTHPSNPNNLYLGSQVGGYRSTNGGTNWHRWNNGIPEATIITEMTYIDSLSSNGKFYILAATYGRGMIVRDISGDDPIGIQPISGNIPTKFSLDQNYPNPFNPNTNIKFDIPKAGNVKLVVYDINGREVNRLINQNLPAGYYNADFNASNLASGVYFYSLEANDFTDVKKMILVK